MKKNLRKIAVLAMPVALFVMIAGLLPAFAGVTVTSPTNGATVSSPVPFNASATSSSGLPITAMRIYVDNTSAYTVAASKLSTSLTMANGSHYVVVQAWDSAGGVYKTPVTINVGVAPAPTSGSGVTVTSPTNGGNVSSPVPFVASAKSSSGLPITAMRIYVDSASAYTVYASSLSTSLNVSSGAHSVVVQAWDSSGAVYKTPLTINAGTAPSPVPPAPVSSGPQYYVSPSGSDSNSGTSASSPWKTISKAAATVGTAGAAIHVAAGTYNEQVMITKSGTSSAHIVYVCDTYRQCFVKGQNYNSNWGASTFVLTGNYTDIMNFDVSDGTTQGHYGILGYGSVGNYRIVGNYVHDITGPNCNSMGTTAIDTEGSETGGGSLVANNMVTRIGTASPGCAQTNGIYFGGNGSVAVNNIVYNMPGGSAFDVAHNAQNVVVAFNTVDNAPFGVFTNCDGKVTCDYNHIVNNIITNTTKAIYEGSRTGMGTHNVYDHNVFYSDGGSNMCWEGGTPGGATSGGCTNTIVGDPKFTNRTGGDFRLLSGSAATGVGSTTNAPANDYYGSTRSTPHDIGAIGH